MLESLEIVHHVPVMPREASVSKAMWHSWVGRVVGAEKGLNGLGASPNQRIPVFLPLVGRSYMGNKGKNKNLY